MLVFHIALAREWEEALARGRYTTSTLGRTLEEEGFVHCAQESQVAFVRSTFYAEVEEPLVLLTVDTDLLTSPCRLEPVPGQHEPFPHVHGPLDLAAVVRVTPLLCARDVHPASYRLDNTDVLRPARTYGAG
jgi:glutathione S-transferase